MTSGGEWEEEYTFFSCVARAEVPSFECFFLFSYLAKKRNEERERVVQRFFFLEEEKNVYTHFILCFGLQADFIRFSLERK